jgi:uncharacterized protein (DUF2267 family)
MTYQEIIKKVQQRGRLETAKEAEQVTRAVLGTLGENIYRTEERELAAQLPKELKGVFYEYQGKERSRGDLPNYPLEEFYNRVKARSHATSFQQARRLAHAVISVLQEAVTPGEIDDVMNELPTGFHRLFDQQEKFVGESQPISPPEKISAEYHVRPGDNGKWIVQRDNEMLQTFDKKEKAIVYADDLADPDKDDVLVIYNIDGSVSKRETPTRNIQ